MRNENKQKIKCKKINLVKKTDQYYCTRDAVFSARERIFPGGKCSESAFCENTDVKKREYDHVQITRSSDEQNDPCRHEQITGIFICVVDPLKLIFET